MKKVVFILFSVVMVSGIVLSSNVVSADDDSVVDQISITVPVSCTLSGTGMDTHNAEINNGVLYGSITEDGGTGELLYEGVGTTIMNAVCNDNNGFAIYAAGFTGDEVGGTNSTKLVGANTGSSNAIITGTDLGATQDVSNWAMAIYKISDSGDTSSENAFAIDNRFQWGHVVPDSYTKVAHKNAATSMDTINGGAKIGVTYFVYISKTQPADTYSGKVKYTLVHPANADAPIEPVTIEDAMGRAGKTKYNGYYKIQDMNSTICSNVNQYSGDGMAEVIDVRDDNIYHIAKLADDNCWMLDNLALDPTDSTTAQNMNSTNTNATQTAITNLLDGGSSTTGWSSVAVVNKTSGWNTTSPNNSFEYPYINNQSKNTLVTSYGPASTNGQAKVGIYYNYCAASASTYCYASGSGVDVPDTIIDAPQDICPANWRMPTGGTTGEYYALAQKYGSTAIETSSLQYNLSTPLSGYYYGSAAYFQGSYGYWWSPTYFSGDSVYSLNVFPTNVYPSGSGDRVLGLSMRCLVSE